MEVIFAYTRREAIADGVLVDVTETAKEAGFRIAVALTAAAWGECVAVPEGGGRPGGGRAAPGCALDVPLWNQPQPEGASEVLFELHVRNDNRGGMPPLVSLKAVCGPDDSGEPCLTIMLPEED